ncbi:LysE family translocator [Paraurantiacibacter namhicola]|uniref:Homoserine/homoserine lactone efflux protein n=1 Tax=Paraurantiacibacter namhicola TaxID=645517 RepID=A0A1C7D8W0_9SPHN|nr:LysE family translocator [Paraurantiacibacter namhicola]ANU07875.1 Homoserine/homoserine lactone efflux protein [Paraurantiacibacter namhicola]
MFAPETLLAFFLVTATTSIVPGVSMLFVTGQAVSHGPRAGWTALAGMQLGYFVWWLVAALGLGALAQTYSFAFRLLAFGGAAYLAWMGVQAVMKSARVEAAPEAPGEPVAPPARNGLRDGMAIAIGNPKSLIYMVAIIPPFIDPALSVVPQIALLALVALVADLLVGAAYIQAGSWLARAMTAPAQQRKLGLGIGFTYIVIAALLVWEIMAWQ